MPVKMNNVVELERGQKGNFVPDAGREGWVMITEYRYAGYVYGTYHEMYSDLGELYGDWDIRIAEWRKAKFTDVTPFDPSKLRTHRIDGRTSSPFAVWQSPTGEQVVLRTETHVDADGYGA